MLNEVLPEFQAFLRSRKLVPEKYVLYYAGWASKFFPVLKRVLYGRN